jgi:hypothetical protein
LVDTTTVVVDTFTSSNTGIEGGGVGSVGGVVGGGVVGGVVDMV